jgi:hypothetical protein
MRKEAFQETTGWERGNAVLHSQAFLPHKLLDREENRETVEESTQTLRQDDAQVNCSFMTGTCRPHNDMPIFFPLLPPSVQKEREAHEAMARGVSNDGAGCCGFGRA